MEKSLINNKQEGMFGDLVNFLLKLCFALLEEEDEEEEKLAQVLNFYFAKRNLVPLRNFIHYVNLNSGYFSH